MSDTPQALTIPPLDLPRGNDIVRIEIREFRNSCFLDFRRYYRDDSDQYKPTSRGTTADLSQLDSIIAHLQKIRAALPDAEG